MENIRKIELEEKQATLFKLFNDSNFDCIRLIETYMKSKLTKQLDKDFSNEQLLYTNEWLEIITSNKKLNKSINKYNDEALRWLGYFYRRWHFITSEPSSKIVSYLPPKDGLKNYIRYHQLEERDVINEIKEKYNLRQNVKRKYQNKKYNLDSLIDVSPLGLLVSAKRLLYKLLKDQKYNNLNYLIDGNIIFNKDYSITVILFNKDNIKEYINKIKEIKIKKKSKDNILFCMFLNLDNQNIESVINNLNKIKNNNFNNVYLYISNSLYEINNINILKYYISINNRDLVIINKEKSLFNSYTEIDSYLKSCGSPHQ